MGCGISRFDAHLHDKDDHDHDHGHHARENRSTKNNNGGGKGRLLFIKKSSTNGGGGDGCRRSVSSPSNNSLSPINNHVKHITSLQHHRRGEWPNVAAKMTSGRDIDNKDLERSENNINCISRDAHEEDDEEDEGGSRRRKCICKDSVDDINVDRIEGSSIMFRGSPSFREYCRPDDRDIDSTNIDHKEEMRKKTVLGIRGEDINNVSNKGSAGISMAAAVRKRVRRFRKVSPNHSPSPPYHHRTT